MLLYIHTCISIHKCVSVCDNIVSLILDYILLKLNFINLNITSEHLKQKCNNISQLGIMNYTRFIKYSI